jgi:hypothetical protein
MFGLSRLWPNFSAETSPPRDEGRLAVVTCHFNPCGFRRPRENYFRFRDALRGAPLFTVEVSFDGAFHTPAEWQLRGGARNVLWQKENLINFAVERLPECYDQVAWVDADLLFLNPDWAAATSAALDQSPVVQLYEHVHYTTPGGRLGDKFPSWMRRQLDGGKGHATPGGAWAARRELLARHGLYDRNIVGGGDQAFAEGLFGASNRFWDRQNPPLLVADYREWQRRLCADVRANVGCVAGDVVHLYHGTRRNRQYVERTAALRAANFDPRTDVRVGGNGLLEWSSAKPQLHRGLLQYFASRHEDE